MKSQQERKRSSFEQGALTGMASGVPGNSRRTESLSKEALPLVAGSKQPRSSKSLIPRSHSKAADECPTFPKNTHYDSTGHLPSTSDQRSDQAQYPHNVDSGPASKSSYNLEAVNRSAPLDSWQFTEPKDIYQTAQPTSHSKISLSRKPIMKMQNRLKKHM